MNAPRSSGFTLVELVIVIILIGVLSFLGIGLFANRGAFSPLLATQQLASATLLAQQAALAGNVGNTLTVSQESDDFVFIVGADTVSEREFRLARNGASFNGGGTSFPITFNEFGRPDTGGNRLFTFSGDSTSTVCLSSLGAVYGGNC